MREQFEKFHALLSMKFSQLMWFCVKLILKMFACAHKTQGHFRAIPQRWRYISESHRACNRLCNLGFICECCDQRAVKGVDAHTSHIHVVCQKANNSCFLGEEKIVLIVELIK
jgi:hypothetical protein